MWGRLLLLVAVVGVLAGCAGHELYRPYTMRHPGSGATVTCGHGIWWECVVFDYKQHGYQRLQEAR